MAVNLSAVAGAAGQFFDNNGNLLSGGKLYTYAAGTTTPETTYTTNVGNVANPNPIVLDSAGRVPDGAIWLTNDVLYKFLLQDSLSNLIGTWDNVPGISPAGSNVFSGPITIDSATNAIGSSGSNTTLGNGTVAVVPAVGFGPAVDNVYVLGGGALRWTTVFATTGTINTSDENDKEQIADLSVKERAVGLKIKSLIKTFKFRDAVAKKGAGARIHCGVIAQDVAAAFVEQGLDPNKYAVFCSDTFKLEDGTEKTRLGVRYNDLFAFLIGAL